jgi:hypothetical protein
MWEEGRGREEESVVDEASITKVDHVCLDAFHHPRHRMHRRFFSRTRNRMAKDFLRLSDPNNPTPR